ncbi:competence/damage-inducible protein A [uncultured Tyzzerella sp.]|uniref:competence/damage-inducible protein A n=1 Tax=uncultured Tyzzerella sp. TaxID=2321398 RepID=UPI002943AEDE|nr:competence/damage-inducible protein A [uncultured Tyzzerella sp.]
MKAEIFSVGTEILLGEILDTNAKYIASELANMGIDVFYKTSIGDNEKRLLDAIDIAYKRADIIISTGGLGPTDDDLTKETFAKYFNKKLVTHKESLENLKSYFVDEDMPLSNLKQADLPENAIVLVNENGTASGCIIEEKNKIAVILPGPPKECIPMFNKQVKPILEKYTDKVLVSKNLNLCGIGESNASEIIRDLMLSSKNPTIAPYAGNNEMRFRITASGKTKEEAQNILKPTVDKLYSIFNEYIYGEDDDTLQEVVVNKLIENNITISTAESCTGGLLASSIVNVASASKVFLNGVISYSNESKVYELNVCKEDLEKYGAVSEQVAIQMAEGIRKKSNTTIGISTTGIAGPTGGTDKKPVGLVYIAISIEGRDTFCKKLMLKGDRQKIRDKTVHICFSNLLKLI